MTVTGASNVKMALSTADDDLDFNPFYKILQVGKMRQLVVCHRVCACACVRVHLTLLVTGSAVAERRVG